MRVLLATSAPERFRQWAPALEREGFQLRFAAPDRRGLGRACREAPDVVLLDLTDGDGDPAAFRRLLRQLYLGADVGLIVVAPEQSLPALARQEIDDAVPLPASVPEIVFRLRRLRGRQEPQPRVLRIGELVVRPAEGQVLLGGRSIRLRYREFELLRFWAAHPDRTFRREQLLGPVWGAEFRGSPRTVDVHVSRLRRKLGRFGQQHLQTVWGIGYRFSTAPAGREPER